MCTVHKPEENEMVKTVKEISQNTNKKKMVEKEEKNICRFTSHHNNQDQERRI